MMMGDALWMVRCYDTRRVAGWSDVEVEDAAQVVDEVNLQNPRVSFRSASIHSYHETRLTRFY